MSRSVSVLEYKVQQARFLLHEASKSTLNPFAAQCYFDAFAGAARSITFAVQSVLSDLPGFSDWYKAYQNSLRADPICQFFNQYRRISVHIGDAIVGGASRWRDDDGVLKTRYYFVPTQDLRDVPSEDVSSICETYFVTLLGLVYECMVHFKCQLDDRWYFTAAYFRSLNKVIEDAEEELGFPRGWTAVGDGLTEADRWRLLRKTQAIGCQLNELFSHYLGKTIMGPDDGCE